MEEITESIFIFETKNIIYDNYRSLSHNNSKYLANITDLQQQKDKWSVAE